MNSLNRMQPYKPRAFCFDELRVLHKCDIKLYGLARRDQFPRTELLAGGKKIAATSCASEFSEADPGGVSWFYFASEPQSLCSWTRDCSDETRFCTSTAALTVLIGWVAVAEKN
jgi:hypothetical protein